MSAAPEHGGEAPLGARPLNHRPVEGAQLGELGVEALDHACSLHTPRFYRGNCLVNIKKYIILLKLVLWIRFKGWKSDLFVSFDQFFAPGSGSAFPIRIRIYLDLGEPNQSGSRSTKLVKTPKLFRCGPCGTLP